MRGGLFWFPERRTGLIYLDKPTTDRSYVLRTAQPKRGGWVVQIVRPLSRSVCYDVPEKDAAGLFSLVGLGSGETLLQWQLDPNLLPRPGDGPHVLAVAPAKWDVATLAWLTASQDSGNLGVRRLTRSEVRDPSAITIDDVGASPLELGDATVSFTLDDRLGPAVKPTLISPQSRVLATFPADAGPDRRLVIELELLDSIHPRVPVQILQRHVQGGRLEAVSTQRLTPKARTATVALSKPPEKLEIYVQTPEEVRLLYRDGSQRQADSGGGQLARRMLYNALSAVDPELIEAHQKALRAERDKLRGESGIQGAASDRPGSARAELLARCGLAGVMDDPLSGAHFAELPAPLVAALLDRTALTNGGRLEAARSFLRWPSASQLASPLGPAIARSGPPGDSEDVLLALWKRTGVDDAGIAWLADNPERQLGILSLIEEGVDACSTIVSLRRLPELTSGELPSAIEDLLEIAQPVWPRLLSLLRPNRNLHRLGTLLLEECATPAGSRHEIGARRQRLDDWVGRVRAHLAELVHVRGQCGPYADEVGLAASAFDRSIEDGLREMERLTKKYDQAFANGSEEASPLDHELENGTAVEFRFDERALATIARDRLEQARVVEWLGAIAALLDRSLDLADLPPWPRSPTLDDLALPMERIRQFISSLPAPADGELADFPPSLRPQAERLRADLDAGLERCGHAIDALCARGVPLHKLRERLEQARERIVLECLRNGLRSRQASLVERHKAIAEFVCGTHDAVLERAVQAGQSATTAATLGSWSDALLRLEEDLAKNEALFAQAQRLLETLPDSQSPPSRSDRLKAIINTQITKWQNETRSLHDRLARLRLYAQAMDAPVPASEANIVEPAIVDGGVGRLEAFGTWLRHHEQGVVSMNEALAQFAPIAGALLTRHCPAVSWPGDAGRLLAAGLVDLGERQPAETLATLVKALEQLDMAWRLSGGSEPDNMRDLIWLGREDANARQIEAILGAVQSPERLLTDVSLHQDLAKAGGVDSMPPDRRPDSLRSGTEFRAFLGRTALNRLARLYEDHEAKEILTAFAPRTPQPRNYWDAIAVLRQLLSFAQKQGRGAEALRTVLKRQNLLPPSATEDDAA